eukprot:14355576-Alexandrium_andersonii.AAC.1
MQSLSEGLSGVFALCNIYGWPDGATVPAARKRTSALIRACLVERAARGDSCAAILGDFNLELSQSEAWIDLQELGWVDLGAHPNWSPAGPRGTCRARPGAQLNRRNYVAVSPAAACRVLAFTVTPCASVPTHFV